MLIFKVRSRSRTGPRRGIMPQHRSARLFVISLAASKYNRRTGKPVGVQHGPWMLQVTTKVSRTRAKHKTECHLLTQRNQWKP